MKTMTKLVLAILLFTTSLADAKPPTQEQMDAVRDLVEAGQIDTGKMEEFIWKNRPDFEVELSCNLQKVMRRHACYMYCPYPLPNPAGCKEGKRLRVRVFHFNRPMTTKQIVAAMNKAGYRPAGWPEFYAYLAAFPHAPMSKDAFLIPLGSIGKMGRCDFRGRRTGRAILEAYRDPNVGRSSILVNMGCEPKKKWESWAQLLFLAVRK